MNRFYLLVAVLFIVSCSSDDNENKDYLEENIVNIWTLENRVISDDDNYIVSDCTKQSSLEFLEDGTFARIEYAKNENGDCNIMLEQIGSWWTNGYYGLSLEVNEEIDTMTADIGNLVEPLLLESDPNGEYLLISNFTSTNQIIEIYKKSD